MTAVTCNRPAKAPIRWIGGKARLAEWIVERLPPHQVYVEVFGGAASVLLAKPRARLEVYNDLHEGVVNLYRVLRDPEQAERLARLVELTPYARAEYRDCAATWRTVEEPVEKARRFVVAAQQSFGGRMDSTGWSHQTSAAKYTPSAVVWTRMPERLLRASERLRGVQIDCRDWRQVLEAYDGEETLFYLDPPYAPEARREKTVYDHEMTAEDHRELAERLLALRGMAILSGYEHEVYRPLEDAGWRVERRQIACSVAGRTRFTGLKGAGVCRERDQMRTECLWISPSAQQRHRQPSLLGLVEA